METIECRIYPDAEGKFRWKIVSRNGRIRADSGEGYATRSNARRAFRDLNDDIVQLGHYVEIVYADE